MASMSTTFCFVPQALARQSTKNSNAAANKPSSPKRSSRKPKFNRSGKFKPQKSKFKPPPQPLTALSESEATSYNCLPPREDFIDSSSLTKLPFVVKLSESILGRENTRVLSKDGREEEQEEEDDDEEEEEKSEDRLDRNLSVDYGRFEVYEINSDLEDEEEEEEEEEDDDNYENYNYKSQEEENIADGEMEDMTDFEGEVAKKGMPAVMRCFDRAKIYVRAGDGGNGVVAFRREKFVPLGGPSGGDGGRGGNVYVEVEPSMNSLLPFRNRLHFRAGPGTHGQGSMQIGAKGEDVVVKVAPGTVIREAGNEEVLLELLNPGQRALLMPGGRGGRGNASFKSGSNKVPKIAENGEAGAEMWLELELKLVADVGIVGAPNAGKSTLLSVISAARPEIANYPFTTLLPNLGVVSFDYDSTMVVADLPGLLEGAHRGFGLGHEFLRHTERCSALIHVVDGSSQQPELEFDAVRLELELFSPEIAEKPYLVAFNKMDLPEACENWPSFRESLEDREINTFCMSAVKKEGTHDVISAAYQLLQRSKNVEKESEEPANLNRVADVVKKQRRAPIDDFNIFHDSTSNAWHVDGAGLNRFVQMTNWRYIDSEKRFQHVLEACGVYKSLARLGVKEGDTVIVGEMEWVWHDSPKNESVKKPSPDSTRWPEWK